MNDAKAPTPDALIAQLKELNERSTTYGRQFWQVPFAYLAGSGIALAQVADKSAIALRIALITIGVVGVFMVWHLVYLYKAAHRAFGGIRAYQKKLDLLDTKAEWTPGHLIALLTLVIAASLASFAAAAVLPLYGRASSPSMPAERSWVLWLTLGSNTGPVEAHSTKAECEQSMHPRKTLVDDYLKKNPSDSAFLRCFPDTVDPRGPKGK